MLFNKCNTKPIRNYFVRIAKGRKPCQTFFYYVFFGCLCPKTLNTSEFSNISIIFLSPYLY